MNFKTRGIFIGLSALLAAAVSGEAASPRRSAPIRRTPGAFAVRKAPSARPAAIPQARPAALPARFVPSALPAAGAAPLSELLHGAAAGINASMAAGDSSGALRRSDALFSGARALSGETSPVSAAAPSAPGKVSLRRLSQRPNRSVGFPEKSGVRGRAVESEFAQSAPAEYIEIVRDTASLRRLLRKLDGPRRGLPAELRGVNWKEEAVVAALVALPSPAHSIRLVGLELDDSAKRVNVSYKRSNVSRGPAARTLTPTYQLIRVPKALVPEGYSARLKRLTSAEAKRWRASKGPYGDYRWRPMDKALAYAVDGDTVYYGKKGADDQLRIRIIGIDTPEVAHFGAGKFVGQAYGKEATLFTRQLIKKGGEVLFLPAGLDKYGRTLAHIMVDGELLSIALLKVGFAYESISRHGDNGMPDIAGDILAAEKAYRKDRKDFENPHDFRQREWSEEKEAEDLKKDLAKRRTKLDIAKIVFDDGDTIRYEGETFRIAGIDTPETKHPEDGIFKDQPYGRQASKLTQKLIEGAKKVEILKDGKDKYDRTLAHVFVDGELLSVLVLRESMAYENIHMFGGGNFPGLSRLILDAARKSPKPPFEYPWKWRQKNQKKRD